MPAESLKHCTLTPGKTVAQVYSFCDNSKECFFHFLIPASYILQNTWTFPPSLSGRCYLYRSIAMWFHSPNSVCDVPKGDCWRQADRLDRWCLTLERGFFSLLPFLVTNHPLGGRQCLSTQVSECRRLVPVSFPFLKH